MVNNKYLENYRLYNKADSYLLGFNYKGVDYCIAIKRLALAWLHITHASHRNGHGKIVRLQLNNRIKQRLIRKGAIPIELLSGYNYGDRLEHTIRIGNGLSHKHDNIPFYKGVDIVINNVGYSIKWENAQLFSYSTINRLLKK